jgi:hypothetical protein
MAQFARCVSVLFVLTVSLYGQLSRQLGAAPTQIAGLHSGSTLLWHRTSPSAGNTEGPVLYQIIFRSSATPGSIPKISSTFTLTNSLISDDGTNIHIGGMLVNGSTGIITFANTQTFPGGGAGTVTSVTAGAGLTGGQITSSGTIGLDTNFTDARYASTSSLAAYLPLSGGTMTGPITLSNPPTNDSQAATKAYVDVAATNSKGSLLADFEFDEPSGTSFADSSGFGDTATAPVGGIASGSAGHSGKSIVFAGGVVTTSVPNSPQVHVEAWINPSQPITGAANIITEPGVFSLGHIASGQLAFLVQLGTPFCQPSLNANISVGSWTHVSGWYNGEQAGVEVNGQSVSQNCAIGPLPIRGDSPLVIGAADSTGGNPFPGSIDEVRLWSTALLPPVEHDSYILNTLSASTTSTSFTDMGLSIVITTGQVPFVLNLSVGGTAAGAAGGTANYRVVEDGSNVITQTTVAYPPNAILPLNLSTVYLPTSPGTHNLALQWASPGGVQLFEGIGSSSGFMLLHRLQ